MSIERRKNKVAISKEKNLFFNEASSFFIIRRIEKKQNKFYNGLRTYVLGGVL